MKTNYLKILATCLFILISFLFVGCARQGMTGGMDSTMEPAMGGTMDTMKEQTMEPPMQEMTEEKMGGTMDEMNNDPMADNMGKMDDTMTAPENEGMMK